MSGMLAVALWCWHGVLLAFNGGAFRWRIALLHGVLMAAVGGLLAVLQLPAWALYAAGAAVGAVGGWGHRLAPGLWVGVGLLALLAILMHSAPVLLGALAFALAAQVAAALVSLSRR